MIKLINQLNILNILMYSAGGLPTHLSAGGLPTHLSAEGLNWIELKWILKYLAAMIFFEVEENLWNDSPQRSPPIYIYIGYILSVMVLVWLRHSSHMAQGHTMSHPITSALEGHVPYRQMGDGLGAEDTQASLPGRFLHES